MSAVEEKISHTVSNDMVSIVSGLRGRVLFVGGTTLPISMIARKIGLMITMLRLFLAEDIPNVVVK